MTNSNTAAQSDTQTEEVLEPVSFLKRITPTRFESWYRERETRENIRNGQAYFNGPSQIPEPTRYSPSRLLQCPRKTSYQELNAPREQGEATGILWFGTRFEEDVALPFLQEAVTGSDTYACNSIWVDFEVETETKSLHIKGETDPAIVTADGTPVLVTEIKTKSSVEHLDSPDQHHKAQVHAYMYGLSEKYDQQLTDAAIIYGSRESLALEVFHVEFDPVFWRQTAIDWAESHSEYRLRNDLPPPSPMFDWECEFCSYKHRCGEGSSEYNDVEAAGLLPLFTYPKAKVVEYLRAHEGAKLTPTLARQYPELVNEYGVFPWHCVACGAEYAWDAPDWDLDTSDPPICPDCRADGTPAPLRGPEPGEQHNIDRGKDDE